MTTAPKFDYLASRADALALLQEFGQTINIRRGTATGTAWDPQPTMTDYSTTGVIVPLTRWYPSFVDGVDDVLRTDRRGLIATLAIVPTPMDQLVDLTGKVWRIMDLKDIAPAGVVVIYDLWLRE